MGIIEVVSVFLKSNDDSYLLQLRDNDPSIVYPGCWGLFGGTIELGESPREAAARELKEEIHYVPDKIYEFRQYQQQNRLINVCYGMIEVTVSELRLQEGMDLGFYSAKEIAKGELFSKKMRTYFKVPQQLQEYFKDFITASEVF